MEEELAEEEEAAAMTSRRWAVSPSMVTGTRRN